MANRIFKFYWKKKIFLSVLLAENGRLAKVQDIIKGFEEIMKAHRGDLFVEVIVAEVIIDFLFSFKKKGSRILAKYVVIVTLQTARTIYSFHSLRLRGFFLAEMMLLKF